MPDPNCSNDSGPTDDETDYADDTPLLQPKVGECVEVLWPLDNQLYPGEVTGVSDNGCTTIADNDDGIEDLKINEEVW